MVKKILKLAGIILCSLVALLVLALGIIYLIGKSKIDETYSIDVQPVSVSNDSAAVAAGQHIARTRGCFACHGDRLQGRIFIDNPAMGLITAANLTPGKGGVGKEYRDRDWIRAIRHGVNREGKSLVIMPSDEFSYLSDGDLANLVAYLKQIPAVDNQLPKRDFGLMPHFISVFDGSFLKASQITHTGTSLPAVTPAVTVEYGAYLAENCKGCHKANLAGGEPPFPGAPPAANITPNPVNGIGNWSKVDFLKAIRQGIRPDGRELDEAMPRFFGHMTDEELSALWLYLQSLNPLSLQQAQN